MPDKKHIATNNHPALLGLDTAQVWDTALAFAHLQACGLADTKRTAERRLHALGLLPPTLSPQQLRDELGRPVIPLLADWALTQTRKRRSRILLAQLAPLPDGRPCLHANDARGARFWLPLDATDDDTIERALGQLQRHVGKEITVFGHGALVASLRRLSAPTAVTLYPQIYHAMPPASGTLGHGCSTSGRSKRLEAESIHLLREAVAEARRPAILCPADKNSGILLHLARKAFYPAPPPLALLHVDTGEAFHEARLFCDFMARESGLELLVHTDAQRDGALQRALEKHEIDLLLDGATCGGTTNGTGPKTAPWQLYNARSGDGRLRIFPLADWSTLDRWQYILQQDIPVATLHLARPRPVVERHGTLIVVDGECSQPLPGEEIRLQQVRLCALDGPSFATAVASDAATPAEILMDHIAAQEGRRR